MLLQFIAALLRSEAISRITVFTSPRNKRDFDLPLSPKLEEEICSIAENSYFMRTVWWIYLIAKRCKQRGVHILVSMSGMGHASRTIPHITLVQQSNPFSSESFKLQQARGKLQFLVMLAMMRFSCRKAARVFVQTPTMREWVCAAFRLPRLAIDVFLPCSPPFPPEDPHLLPNFPMLTSLASHSILYVGSDSRHKNLALIVNAMKSICSILPRATLFATLPANHPVCDGLSVVGLGHLARTHLYQAYKHATVLVLPSLVETVGLPLLEAIAIGTPVLAADRPYAHDVCEDAAVFFDPLDEDDYVRKLLGILENSELRSEMIEKGHRLVTRRIGERPYERMVTRIVEIALGQHEN